MTCAPRSHEARGTRVRGPLGTWDDGASMLALPKDRSPLLGRSTEIEVLTGLLHEVESTGAALVVRGDPGIGKSRASAIASDSSPRSGG
jgi:DNA-binding NtrC family response regulator